MVDVVSGYLNVLRAEDQIEIQAGRYRAQTLSARQSQALYNEDRLSKIQLDQALRNFLMGHRRGLWRRRDVDYSEAGIPTHPSVKELVSAAGDDVTALGTVANEMIKNSEITYTRVATRHIDPTIPGDKMAGRVALSRAEHLRDLSSDGLTRKVATYGPDDTLRYLTEHPDTRLGRWYAEDMKPLLDQNNITPIEWLRRTELEIEQAVGGDAALRRAISTGKLETELLPTSGAAIEARFVLDELDEAHAQLARVEDGPMRQELLRRVDQLEERVGRLDQADLKGKSVKMENLDAVSSEVLVRWGEGRYKMPDEVIVKRSVVPDEGITGVSNLDKARALAQKGNRLLYQGFRPLSAIDLKLTRGSTYRSVFDRVYKDLTDRGFKGDTAIQVAHNRAAYIARDLHYDISARSSFDRAMKDYFWFSPVWREQLTTYLYKIPSRHYWPVGFALRTFEAYSVLDTLKDFGIIEWEEYQFLNEEGELETSRSLVMNVPWISDFIGKVVGNEESGKLKIEGMNPLTPGTAGVLPTLGPGAEAILDMSAKAAPDVMRPFFDMAADLFTFDQDTEQGPSWLPSPIRSAMELFGIHVPFDTFNLEDWREAERKANVQSIRWAMSDLSRDGIFPPGQDASDEEVERYKDLIIERSRYYERTLGILHLVGNAIMPGQFTRQKGVTTAGTKFYEFRNSLPEDLETEEYYSYINSYLRVNPEAYPYSTGAHPGKYGTPTYDSTRTIEADDFVEKVLSQAHYWMESVDEDGNVSKDVPEGEKEQIKQRQGERVVVNYAIDDTWDLKPEQVDRLGVPAFSGRDDLLKKLGSIQKRYDEQYNYNLSDAKKDDLNDWRDRAMNNAAAEYGRDGKQLLEFAKATPAERLSTSGYFKSDGSSRVMTQVKDVTRQAVAAGSSPQFAAASTGVLANKIALYKALEKLRLHDPQFDREMRRAEITLGERDTTRGRVGTYEYIFFGQNSNAFGYQDDIVRGLNS